MATKARVLCVDDEPAVLEGLGLTLRRTCEVVTAPGGEAGLEVLRRDATVAVVVSDMRMPGMDGATFLGKARAIAPDATRVLLTGHAEIDAAIAAINEGAIFRFLTKPAPPAMVTAAVEAAIQQHRLVTSERELLEQTLRGSIQLLMDVLAVAAPLAFGRAMRIKQAASDIASKLAGVQAWPVEVAAMLSQLGCVGLPPSTLEKLNDGGSLDAEEEQAVERLPTFAEQLLGQIPRLDQVRAALRYQRTAFEGPAGPAKEPRGKAIPVGARILRIVTDFDRLETGGLSQATAIETMRGRRGVYDREILEVFATLQGNRGAGVEVREMPIRQVRIGMTFVDDVRTQAGALLIARGHQATASLLERIRNFPAGTVREPVRVALSG